MKRRKKPITIVRPDADGEPDDIVIDCDSVHLERMDDNLWWLGVYRGKKCLHLSIFGKGRQVLVAVGEDELGVTDDTKKEVAP